MKIRTDFHFEFFDSNVNDLSIAFQAKAPAMNNSRGVDEIAKLAIFTYRGFLETSSQALFSLWPTSWWPQRLRLLELRPSRHRTNLAGIR